jgi:hypothetical protein
MQPASGRKVVVLKAVGDPEMNSYENREGGLFTSALTSVVKKHRTSDQFVTWNAFFTEVKSRTNELAARHHREQTPAMDLYFGTSGNENVLAFLQDLECVMVVCPHYEDELKLPGSQKDVIHYMVEIGYSCHRRCKVVLLMDNPPEDVEDLLHSEQEFCRENATQHNFRKITEEMLVSGKSMGIFAVGHGLTVRGKDGYVDQEYVIGGSAVGLESAINGRYMGQVISSFFGSNLLIVFDGCKVGGLPDTYEVSHEGSVISRNVPNTESVLSTMDTRLRTTMKTNLFMSVLQPLVPANAPLVSQFENSDTGSSDGSQPGIPSAVPLHEITAVEAGLITDNSSAPVLQATIETEADDDVNDRGLDVNFLDAQYRQQFENIRDLIMKGVGLTGKAWSNFEGLSGLYYGESLPTLLGLSVLSTLVLVGISFLSALFLCVCYVLENSVSTLGPVVLMTALATLWPYVCDPVVLQNWMPFEGAFAAAAWNLCFAMGVMVTYVLMNYDRLRALEKIKKVMGWSLGYIAQSKKLFVVGLSIYFFDQGPTVQQTMKIRVGGVESFVLYYPMNWVNGSHVCTIPVSNNGQVYFLRKNSTFNKKVIGGYEADFTCDFQVFKNRVAKRSLRQIENLVYLSFLEGQYVLNLTDIQTGNPYLQNILKEAAVPSEGEMPDPVNPKQHVQWPIRIENVVGQADKKTYLEWAAMPVMSFVSKSTALASTGLTFVWDLLGRLPR